MKIPEDLVFKDSHCRWCGGENEHNGDCVGTVLEGLKFHVLLETDDSGPPIYSAVEALTIKKALLGALGHIGPAMRKRPLRATVLLSSEGLQALLPQEVVDEKAKMAEALRITYAWDVQREKLEQEHVRTLKGIADGSIEVVGDGASLIAVLNRDHERHLQELDDLKAKELEKWA